MKTDRAWPRTAISALLALALLPAGAAPAAGEEIIVQLDPEASRIAFTLAATLHTVEGRFQLTAGEIHIDPATGEATGRVVVDAASGDTGNEKRDRDMHTNVLESEAFPHFVFIPERVEGTFEPEGTSQVVLHGSLEVHGATHSVAIAAEVRSENGRLEADGRFEVPYVEWGMEDPSKFILRVAKSVEVEVYAVGRVGSGAGTGPGKSAPDDPGG